MLKSNSYSAFILYKERLMFFAKVLLIILFLLGNFYSVVLKGEVRASLSYEHPMFPIDVTVLAIDGVTKVNTLAFSNYGHPVMIILWSLTCKPCKIEMDTLVKVYKQWQDQTGLRIIAICSGSASDTTRINSVIQKHSWPFEFYLDNKGEFRKALIVDQINKNKRGLMPENWGTIRNEEIKIAVPQTYIFNSNMEVTLKKLGYSPDQFDELKTAIIIP